jgi:uncharacterized protein YyaL (SSP411 family)
MTTEPLLVPSLRPQWQGQPFPGTELPDLATALRQVQQWIDAGEVRLDQATSRWTAWPDQPEFQPIYGPVSLNTGAAGIAWYSMAAAAADPASGEEHLARARRALAYVADHWREHADDAFLGIAGTGTGFYGGLAGIAAVLLEAADQGVAPRSLAVDVLEAILERRGRTGGRAAGWTGVDAMLGDGGVVIVLTEAARRLGDPRYLQAATAVGDLVLAADERDTDGGATWVGVPPALLGLPASLTLDGFELGTVGIGYVLARLAQATGEARFREAAARAAAAITRSATVVGDAALFRRMSGDYSFGYCTGSSGVIRALVGIHQATGEPELLEWAQRFGRGILRSGVPGRQSPGNALVHHQCCGSAAVLESFLGLWTQTGDQLWLDAAHAQGDDLLIRSVVDDKGRRWYSESHALPTGTLKAEVGHQVGASGIAVSLLRLQTTQNPAVALPRLPDDPFGG